MQEVYDEETDLAITLMLSVTMYVMSACLLLMNREQQLSVKLQIYTIHTENDISRTKRLNLDKQRSKWVNISFHNLFSVSGLSSFLSS